MCRTNNSMILVISFALLNNLVLICAWELTMHKVIEWKKRHSTDRSLGWRYWPFPDFFHFVKQVTFYVAFNTDIDQEDINTKLNTRAAPNKTMPVGSQSLEPRNSTNDNKEEKDYLKFNISDAKLFM